LVTRTFPLTGNITLPIELAKPQPISFDIWNGHTALSPENKLLKLSSETLFGHVETHTISKFEKLPKYNELFDTTPTA